MTKRERRPGGGGAADFSTDRRGPQHSKTAPRAEAKDPTRRLFVLPDDALARHGTIRLPGGRVVWVRPGERQP